MMRQRSGGGAVIRGEVVGEEGGVKKKGQYHSCLGVQYSVVTVVGYTDLGFTLFARVICSSSLASSSSSQSTGDDTDK